MLATQPVPVTSNSASLALREATPNSPTPQNHPNNPTSPMSPFPRSPSVTRTASSPSTRALGISTATWAGTRTTAITTARWISRQPTSTRATGRRRNKKPISMTTSTSDRLTPTLPVAIMLDRQGKHKADTMID